MRPPPTSFETGAEEKQMVKLIVTDMDNTLLPGDKVLPREIFPLLRRLTKRGIVFAVGSARNYNNLSRIFAEVEAPVGYICDNGACVEYGGRVLAKEALRPEQIRRVLAFCKGIEGVYPLLVGRDAVYYQDPPPFVGRELPPGSTEALYREEQVPDLAGVRADIFRVGLHDPQNPLYHSLPLLQDAFGGELNVVATDDESVDIMLPGVDKGTGLAALQEALGVGPEETMAFGDYYNDLPMLERAAYSYAMANGLEEVKARCLYLAASNEEGGVLRAIEEYLRGAAPQAPLKG